MLLSFSKAGAKVLLFFDMTKFFGNFFTFFCIFLIFFARVRPFLIYKYNNRADTPHSSLNALFRLFAPFASIESKKKWISKVLIISKLQRKCIFFAFFLQKYLVNSKICCTFAVAFEKQVCFYFLPKSGY